MTRLKRLFLQGLFVALPAALTGYVLYFVLKLIYDYADFVLLFLPKEIRAIPYWAWIAQTAAVVTTVSFIVVVGMVAKTIFGKFFQTTLNGLMHSLPIVRSIYGPLKQFVEVLFSKGNSTFSRPVIVPFPHKDRKAIGFLTGSASADIVGTKDAYYKVFVPTVPNPTSGFLLFFRKEDVTFTDMTTEDAMRLILSGGILH